jgi:hypothetical protein
LHRARVGDLGGYPDEVIEQILSTALDDLAGGVGLDLVGDGLDGKAAVFECGVR